MSDLKLQRFPRRRFYGEAMATSMAVLRMGADQRNAALDAEGWLGRRVLGFKIPEWQRPEVWSEAQCVAFIESVWMGSHIGAFMVNSVLEPHLDQVLVDGQQRLRALERYWNDEFPLCGDDGRAWYWSDLICDEQAHMDRIHFPWMEVRYGDDAILRDVYNRHNFGGSPHLETERALDAGDLRDATSILRF